MLMEEEEIQGTGELAYGERKLLTAPSDELVLMKFANR